jgi:sugar phosphate isomerase/epimerase
MSIQIAFSTNAFRSYIIERSLQLISQIGYTGVEIMCDTPHAFPPLSKEKLSSIKKTLRNENLRISNLNGFMMCAVKDFHHPSWIEKDEGFRQKRVIHTINCLKLAKQLGAKTVSTEPGGPLDGLTEKKGLELFRYGMEQVIPVAEKLKIKLLIEPEPGLLLENSSQFLRFISQFDTKYVGLNFDIGHFYCVKEEPTELLKTLKDYTAHIHLEDIPKNRMHTHLIPGHGAIDFEAIFNVLHNIDYKGFVTVELYPYQDKPEDAAKSALSFLKSFLC